MATKIILFIFFCLGFTPLAYADRFLLTDGQTIDGQLLRYHNKIFIIKKFKGAVEYIKSLDLLSISLETNLLPTVAEIKRHPEKYLNQTVALVGEYQGWTAAAGAPPVTRSDWVLKDETGMIYVSGILSKLNPLKDRGKIIETFGIVARNNRGEIYLIHKSTKICQRVVPAVTPAQKPEKI